MFVPSLEAAKITISLLENYNHEESITDAIQPGYKYVSEEDYLQDHFANNSYTEEMQDMIAEFFFRISKYRKYLYMILEEYAATRTLMDLKECKEIPVYIVLLYLLVIELNDTTKYKIQDLISSIDEKKGLGILTFFKNCDITSKLFKWGCRIWDIEYVEDTLKNVIRGVNFEEVYDGIVTCIQKTKNRKGKSLTKPKTPNLTKRSKKKMITIESESSGQSGSTKVKTSKKSTLPPPSTYNKPKLPVKLEMEKMKHRLEAKKLLEAANKFAYRASKVEKSEKFKNLLKKYEKEKYEASFKKPVLKKIKVKEEPSAKKTATVILREGARLLKIEQEEIKKYENLASGGFNTDLLLEWEEELREKEYQKNLEELEKKHLEGLLSHEESLLAKQKYLKKKRERVEEFRKDKENLMRQLEILKNEEHLKILEAVEKGKAIGKGAKDAMEQIKEEKHKIALEVMEESKVLKERYLKEKEEEMQRKIQLIKEIKALQAIGEIRIKQQIDLNQTANLGLLYEMSIAELRERLFLMKMEMAEELEKKRTEVKMKKECRKAIIDTYQDLIDSHQKIVEEQKKSLEFEEKKELKGKKNPKPSQSLDYLRKKLKETRQQRAKIQI